MKKIAFTLLLVFLSFYAISQTYVSSDLITRPDLGSYNLADIAIGANTEFKNNNNLLVKGEVMYSSYSSDNNTTVNSFGIEEYDENFSENLLSFRSYLNSLTGEEISYTEINGFVFGNGVYKFNNSVNLTDGGGVKFIGDDKSVLVINIEGDLNIEKNARIQIDGIRPENIFWNVSGSINIGNMVEISGVFLSGNSITTGQNIYGGKSFFSTKDINIGELNQDLASYLELVSLTEYLNVSLSQNQCNLVNNYSFEDKTKCPETNGKIDYAYFWSDASGHIDGYSGSDLFGCDVQINSYAHSYSNDFGGQTPRTGFMMGGEYIFSKKTTNISSGYREFMCNELKKVLKSGATYKVEFYVSAGDKNKSFCSNMGIHFANQKFILTHGDNPQIPQVVSSNIITNITSWTKIEGTFIANGTEKYLYIGNFEDDWNTPYQDNSNGSSYYDDAYYYIDDVSVTEITTDLEVNAGTDKCNKTFQGVQLGGAPAASGGSGVYTYKWTPSTGLSSTTIANPIANPTTQTTYKLTVEDVYGCAEYDEVTVYVENISHDFNVPMFQKYDNFQNMPVEFTSDCKNCNKVVWYFGDGSTYTSNSTNVAFEKAYHVYSKPGNYLVKVYYYNECFVGANRGPIYITPNQFPVDNNLSLPYRTYSVNRNNNFINPFSNATDIAITSQMAPISNPLVLNTNPGRFEVKGELRIKSGASLEIRDITIMFGPQGKIIVEPGGFLKLNGCTLRGFKFQSQVLDELMWSGVEVHSKLENNGIDYTKGNLTMINNATIQDAYIGIAVGELETSAINAPSNNSEFHYNAVIGLSGGGLININGAKFINNGTCIRFYGIGYNFYNRSEIKHCTFISSAWGLKDPYYYSLIENYYDLKGHNPHMLGSNPNITFPIGRTSQGIDIISCKGIEISNNTFNGINHPITLTNCRAVKVKSNTFDNTPLAIYINGIFDVYSNNTIFENTFHTSVQTCIKTKGSNGDNIQSNLIRDLSSPTSTISTEGPAIELESSNFIVRDNIIKDYGTAIKIIGDPISANYGFIGNKASGNKIEANSFMPFITTEGNNKKLLIKCNEFKYPPVASNNNKYVWQISNAFGNQGIPNTINNISPYSTPAGNIFDFGSSYPVRKVDNSSQTNINYYYRHTNDFCTPIPYDNTFFKVQDNKVNYVDYATSCILPIISEPVPIKFHIDALRGIANTFTDELTTVSGSLDQNNSDELIALLNTTENWDDINTILIEHSPLSENVLALILNSPSYISEEGFLNLMTYNLPIYDNLNADLNNVIGEVFPGIKDAIQDLIGYNPTVRTPKAIEIDIDKTEKEKMFYVTNYLELMDQTNELENALDFLDDDYSNEITKVQFSDALYQGNYDLASSYRDKMIVNNEGDQRFSDYSNFLLSIRSDNRTYWEMDSIEKEFLYSFATQCPQTMENKQAENLIKVVFGDTVEHCNTYSGRSNNNTSKPVIGENITRFLGDGYPNPANNKFYIPFIIDDITNSYMEIYDINGSLITKKKINAKQGTLNMEVDQLSSGIYFYKLLINGIQVEVKRLAIIK